MKQAQQLQEKMARLQEELAAKTVEPGPAADGHRRRERQV